MDNVELRLKKLIAEVIDNKEVQIDKTTNLMTDLGMDSISVITLLVRIEEEFKIQFPDELLSTEIITQFSLVLDFIQHKIKKECNSASNIQNS